MNHDTDGTVRTPHDKEDDYISHQSSLEQDDTSSPLLPQSGLTPVTVPAPDTTTPYHPAPAQPIRGAKLAFLVLLIAGASAMALVSIVALLVGGFNDFVGKALLTVFIMFSHSLLILSVVTALTTEQLKRSLVGMTIVATAGANIVTSILGLWKVIPSQASWHLTGLYFVLLGGAFIGAWLLRMTVGRSASDGVVKAALITAAVFIVALVPWVLVEEPSLPPLYYRGIGALLILLTALVVITAIVRQIVVSREPGLKVRQLNTRIQDTVTVIFGLIGAVTAIVWLVGLAGFYASATEAAELRTVTPADSQQRAAEDAPASTDNQEYDGSDDPYDTNGQGYTGTTRTYDNTTIDTRSY